MEKLIILLFPPVTKMQRTQFNGMNSKEAHAWVQEKLAAHMHMQEAHIQEAYMPVQEAPKVLQAPHVIVCFLPLGKNIKTENSDQVLMSDLPQGEPINSEANCKTGNSLYTLGVGSCAAVLRVNLNEEKKFETVLQHFACGDKNFELGKIATFTVMPSRDIVYEDEDLTEIIDDQNEEMYQDFQEQIQEKYLQPNELPLRKLPHGLKPGQSVKIMLNMLKCKVNHYFITCDVPNDAYFLNVKFENGIIIVSAEV
jgi:hypothetical protein